MRALREERLISPKGEPCSGRKLLFLLAGLEMEQRFWVEGGKAQVKNIEAQF